MKKAFALFMAMVLCLSLHACNSGNNTNSAETTELNDGRIELTLDNYEQYLELYKTIRLSGVDEDYKKFGIELYHDLECEINTRGVSDNFNYYEIEVVADIDLTYKEYLLSPKSTPGRLIFMDFGEESQSGEVTINNVNVAGESSGTKIFSQDNLFNSIDNGYSVNFEVKSVSGYVVPAK